MWPEHRGTPTERQSDFEEVRIHSEVDIITNSSTCIYTWAREDSITRLKTLVNGILAHGGCDKTFDDLFEAEIVNTSWYKEDWEAMTDKQRAQYDDFEDYLDSIDTFPESYIVVKDKATGQEVDWSHLVGDIYYQDARYDG